MKISDIGKDKWLHYGACLAIAILFGLFGLWIGMKPIFASVMGFCVATAAGFGKEYGDKVNPSNYWDWKDVIADEIGAFMGGIVIFLFGIIF